MLKEFFESSHQLAFLQELLSKTPLPIYDTVRLGDYVVEGCVYIFGFHIIRCTQTGILEDNYVILSHYTLGEHIPNITVKNSYVNNLYDSGIHKSLGTYLRYMRDVYDMDLMSMYNAFDCNTFDDISLTYPDGTEKHRYNPYAEKDNTKKVYAIPIKFNQVYTLCLDASSDVVVYPILKSERGYMGVSDNMYFKNDGNNEYYADTNHIPEMIKMYGIGFNSPKTFSILCDKKELFELERYLYILIQTENTNDSSIVLLEGDYSVKHKAQEGDFRENTDVRKYCGYVNTDSSFNNDCNTLDVQYLNNLFNDNIELLRMNTGTYYAYDDKIIQYFLHNVITNRERITNNIDRVMDLTGHKSHDDDIWDTRLRCEVMNKFNHFNDFYTSGVNGFVDSDVEKILMNNRDRLIDKEI